MNVQQEKRKGWSKLATAVVKNVDAKQRKDIKHALIENLELLDTKLGDGIQCMLENDIHGENKQLLNILLDVHNGIAAPEGFQLSEENYASLLKLTMVSVQTEHDERELERSISMLMDLAILFPHTVQPMVILAGLLWREKGIEAAKQLYELLVQLYEHPSIFYYAGDCFLAAGDKEQARHSLRHAINLCDADPFYYDLGEEIKAYKREHLPKK